MVLAFFLAPVLLHLVLAAPSGRIADPARRVAAVVGYAVTAFAAIGIAITRDPFLDLSCWDNCTDNVFAALPDPAIAQRFEAGWHAAVVIGGIGGVAVACASLAAATPVARSVGWPLLASTGLANLAVATRAAALLVGPAENPARAGFLAIFYLQSLSLTSVAIGLVAVVLEQRRRLAAVARLAADLAAAPAVGALQTMLSRSLGDRSLSVAYWLPGPGRFVNGTGESVDPKRSPGRATTTIVRGGRPIAVITHDCALDDDDRKLGDQIGPAARLAIDNERLMAEVLDQLTSLRAVRGRIVSAADDTRRRIERDLHDGAQQRLLAVTFELRLARAETTDAPHVALLEIAITRATAALSELRDIAHGIFPAILDESGLTPALWSLTDKIEAPVNMSLPPDLRLPAATERSAYLVVVEALGAVERGDQVALAMHVTDGRLTIDIDGLTMRRTIELDDRVGAAGGTLQVGDRHLRAVLPCG
jgi:signal transduction histidine kinase